MEAERSENTVCFGSFKLDLKAGEVRQDAAKPIPPAVAERHPRGVRSQYQRRDEPAAPSAGRLRRQSPLHRNVESTHGKRGHVNRV